MFTTPSPFEICLYCRMHSIKTPFRLDNRSVRQCPNVCRMCIVHLPVRLSVCTMYMSVGPIRHKGTLRIRRTALSVNISVPLSVCKFATISVPLSVYKSVTISVPLSVCKSVTISVLYLYVSLSIFRFHYPYESQSIFWFHYLPVSILLFRF